MSRNESFDFRLRFVAIYSASTTREYLLKNTTIDNRLCFTALVTNTRILKFKSQLTIAFFAAVNHLNGSLRKQSFPLTGSKGQGLRFVIGGFRSVLCVSVFQGSLLVIVIMIDGSEKRNREGDF